MKQLIDDHFYSVNGEVASYYNLLCDRLGIETTAGKEFLKIALENAKLMDNKQKDYGSRNIGDFGTYGILVRMNDKFQRILNLMKGGRRKKAANESVLDSFRDLSNYAIIAVMVETKKWPNE